MGTTQRRQREAARRREEILAAALGLFRKQGYDSTTMPQIAAAAELAPGTLYLYFCSKDALYVELLLQGYEILRQRLANQAAIPGPARQRAEAMIDIFFDFARDFPEYFEIIFFVLQRGRGGGWGDKFPPQQVQRLLVQQQACKQAAGAILKDALPESSARINLIVEAVWSMLTGVVQHFAGDDAFAKVARQAKSLILAGIFGPAGG